MTMFSGFVGSTAMVGSLAASPGMLAPFASTFTWMLTWFPNWILGAGGAPGTDRAGGRGASSGYSIASSGTPAGTGRERGICFGKAAPLQRGQSSSPQQARDRANLVRDFIG